MISNQAILCVLFLAAFCISGILGAGGNNCWAPPSFFGSECKSTTSIIGRPGHKIVYSISFNGNTLLCCKAFYCRSNRCKLYDIGCSARSWRTNRLPWGNNLATPSLQCKGVVLGAAYSFTH
ncbi:uncharacterized protein LOC132759941 [Ruditapes philippinarum]|uniref:uncharacterized protein LOC132759941 n=1 Tax=Ruditapes philippinarum TaxID=129788 RepID=UPI00295B89D1|nr:uncharacterized protein LOC132759941 [Ruditapes philippinarum]